jgi:endo-1,4-beta-D-glucanase Y
VADPFVSAIGQVVPWDTVLVRTWEGVKDRNVRPFAGKMVHRPKSEFPGDAVSEGISYGMFLALYMNDQEYFNSIWNAGEQHMWSGFGGFYNWHRNEQGGPGESAHPNGPASDADQDIALLLIFAHALVREGIWQPFTSMRGATYEQRARSILQTVRTTMIDRNGFLRPGQWGGADDRDIINPGYFAPAFYRIFAEFEPAHASTWLALVNRSYDLIERSPGYSRGLLPDWCTSTGGTTGGAGYNAYRAGDAMYRDAIRVYWRLAKDYLWYGEPRAKVFLDNAVAFIEDTLRVRGGIFGPEAANFFEMNGDLLPPNDIERLAGGTIPRSRREHSHLTAGMWASAAIGTGNVGLSERYSERLISFYEGSYYWGNAVDPTPEGGRMITIDGVPTLVPEDTLRNETYFDQFLAWFGAALLAGATVNVWEDLKDGIPDGTPLGWRSPPVVSSKDIDASQAPLRVSASFTRGVRWTATLKNDSTGATVTFSENSDTVSIEWYGLSNAREYMPQGFYTLTIDAPNLPMPYIDDKIWLGRPYAESFMVGHRLLVDDFSDGDLVPNIGNEWTTFTDNSQGGASTGNFAFEEIGGSNWLRWNFELSRGGLGFDPFAALEWNCRTSTGGAMDLRGIDTLIIVARVPSGTLDVEVQLFSTDFNFPAEFQLFATNITLTSTQQEFRMPISGFTQRHNGSGKDLNTTLQTMTGIIFQVQEADGATGAILMDRMYLTGDVSGFYSYTEPPEYIEPPVVGIAHRTAPQARHSIKKVGNAYRITLPQNMAGATATVIDIRGRVTQRAIVPENGILNITTRNMATGMYFVEIRKPGVTSVRMPLGNIR